MKIAELSGDEGSGESSRTFVFTDEGHTLGNALRTVIAGYPETVFCGYTVPHPAEAKMHLRIQTNGLPASQLLTRALTDLEAISDRTLVVFEEAMADWKARQLSLS